jgi:secondary thiamine-phosphate synthase enzyme
MAVATHTIRLSTKGNADIVDITPEIAEFVDKLKMSNGIVTASLVGSTGALTTCEFEPGLVADIKDMFDKLIPPGAYHHDKAWGDGNGHSHLRASLVGPSLTVPFVKRKLCLGTWQQVIFIDFDNRARKREIVVQCIGE